MPRKRLWEGGRVRRTVMLTEEEDEMLETMAQHAKWPASRVVGAIIRARSAALSAAVEADRAR